MPSSKEFFKLDLKNKLILVRVDLNLPVVNGVVQDETRLQSVLPTIQEIIKKGGKVVLCSHFGRPNGEYNKKYSLKPLIEPLSKALNCPIIFSPTCIGPEAEELKNNLKEGQTLLLENLRFHKGEETNNKDFSKDLTLGIDYFVNDAFSCSHRRHSSTVGVTNFLPSFMGTHLEKEIKALEGVLNNPNKPVAAIIGGSKVSTKIDVINFLLKKMDIIIIGGAMANTFVAAKGLDVGKSLFEKECIDLAKELIEKSQNNNCNLILPTDFIVSKNLKKHAEYTTANFDSLPHNMMALDIGPKSIELINKNINNCKTILWNGPLGAFETYPFDKGTNKVASHVSSLTKQKKILSVAGGGDTVSALNNAKVLNDFSYVSTAGGAFLEWLEGKVLPGIEPIS